jgi:hypothetical protein
MCRCDVKGAPTSRWKLIDVYFPTAPHNTWTETIQRLRYRGLATTKPVAWEAALHGMGIALSLSCNR